MTEKTVSRQWVIERRQVVWLFLLGIAVFLLVPQVIGIGHVTHLLRLANPIFLLLALGAEVLRYVVSAGSTLALARVFDIDVPLIPTVVAFFASAAANRTFSTGGAPGMLIRFAFLRRQGVPAGAVAVVFLIEDLVGLVVSVTVLLIGIVALTNALPPGVLILDSALISVIGSPLFILIGWWVYRRRAWVERGVHAVARTLRQSLGWLLGRPVLDPQSVQRALGDFYSGMSAARRAPLNVAAVCLLNVIRYIGGVAALYFASLAMGWPISPGALILIFTSVSVISTVSAVPGEVAIMGTSFALLSLAFGVPRDAALMAILLSRSIAFWMPIPIGYAAFWNLRRKHLI